MKKLIICIIMGLILGFQSVAMAANTATQAVTFQVNAINELAVSGNPGAMVVDSASAGGQPTAVQDNSTTYSITTNQNKRITGSINIAMPAGTTLAIDLVAAGAGTSAGSVALSTTAGDLVTGITPVAQGAVGITYTFSASAVAGTVGSTSRTVLLTLQD